MKLLFVTPRFPYPFPRGGGDQVVSYNRIRTLHQYHEIILLSLYEKDEDLYGMEEMSRYCEEIHVIKLTKWEAIRNVLFHAPFSNLPLQVLYYRSPKFEEKVLELCRGNLDLIHVFQLRAAPYLSAIQRPKILELIDSMSLFLKRRIDLEKSPKKWLYSEEYRRVSKYEPTLAGVFDHLFVVADLDRKQIPAENISVVPTGVNTQLFFPQENVQKKYSLIFSGSMWYAPNVQAVEWFITCCWPIVCLELSSITLAIVGRNPSKQVLKFSTYPGITVTGSVDSMPDTLNQCQIAIAPMQSGAGMQFKILEAMACELPVVTTSLGLGSIMATSPSEIMVANEAEAFALTILELLRSPEKMKNIGRKARQLVMKKYSWENTAQQINHVYDQIIVGRS
ncbi:glycosyltransferase family 4 protein [Deltaproteobacteria bacterium TL4]